MLRVTVYCDHADCGAGAPLWDDNEREDFADEAEALASVIQNDGWRQWPDGLLLCAVHSRHEDCVQRGHTYGPWLPPTAFVATGVETWRRCENCGGIQTYPATEPEAARA